MIPQSLKSVQTAETWYREGEGSFSDFLELQATAYNFQLSLERAKADYGKTLVKLELLTKYMFWYALERVKLICCVLVFRRSTIRH